MKKGLLAEWTDPTAEITARRARHPLLLIRLAVGVAVGVQTVVASVSVWAGRGVPAAQVGTAAGLLLVGVLHRAGLGRFMAASALLQVACSPRANADALAVCAGSWDWQVRANVAGNGHAPAGLLGTLAADPVPEVRCAAAGNPASPPDAVPALARDREEIVVNAVAARADLTAAAVSGLAESAFEFPRSVAAGHAMLPDDAAMLLAGDRSARVRRAVAANEAACAAARAYAALADL